MWAHYRIWKHVLGPALLVAVVILMKGAPELSPQWYVGIAIALGLGVAYLAEELFWMAKRQGRPCGHCGKKVQMKSFRVHATCPHCGKPLE